MKPPRISIAMMMGAVIIAALGMLAYQIYHEYVIGVVPMACLLAFGLLVVASDVRRRGYCHPFLFGIELAGWGALFAGASFMVINLESGQRPLARIDTLTQWYVGPTRWNDGFSYEEYDILIFHTLVFLIPEVVIAMIGGWIATALGVTIARRPREFVRLEDTAESV